MAGRASGNTSFDRQISNQRQKCKIYLSIAHSWAFFMRKPALPVSTSNPLSDLSADPLSRVLACSVYARLLHESVCLFQDAHRSSSAPEQSKTLMPPLMSPTASSFFAGCHTQSCKQLAYRSGLCLLSIFCSLFCRLILGRNKRQRSLIVLLNGTLLQL